MRFADTEDYELVDGVLAPLPARTSRHNKMRDLIGHLLWTYFQRNPIGEVIGKNHCRVADGKVRLPDVSVFLADRLRLIDWNKIPAPFAPDIAIEVLSPSEGMMETRGKVREYLSSGSVEVWLIDPANREIQVHTLAGIRILEADGFLETPLLPEFRLRLADLRING